MKNEKCMSKKTEQPSDDRKLEMWSKIVDVYKKAVDDIESIMKSYADLVVYEDKYGWDRDSNSLGGTGGTYDEKMTPKELLYHLADTDGGRLGKHYIYTNDEIEMFRANKDLSKIDSWKETIEFYKESIKKYEKRIEDALANAEKIKSDGNVCGAWFPATEENDED